MASEWAYKIARNQRRDVETMAANLDAARIEGLEEAAKIAEMARDNLYDAEVNREFMSAAAIGAETCKKKIRKRIEEVKG